MWFDLIRFVVWLSVFIVCLIVVKQTSLKNKRKWTILLSAVILILWFISSFIPVENVFVTFHSPTAAYQYTHVEKAQLTVEGDNTDLVVGGDDTTITFAILRKENGGWKLENKFNAETIYSNYSKGVSVDVYRHKETGDCYIAVFMTNYDTNDIKDNYNTTFSFYDFSENSASANTFYSAYAFIGALETNYELNVNGVVFQIAAVENTSYA